MPVQCLDLEQKINLWTDFNGGDGLTKSELARKYSVSTRTVTRVIEEVEELDGHEDLHMDVQSYDEYLNSDTVVEDINEDVPEVQDTHEYYVIATSQSISLTRVTNQSSTRIVNVTPDNEKFDEVNAIVWDGRGSQESLERAFELADKKTYFEKYTDGLITVDPEANRVFYTINGVEQDIHGKLLPRIMEALSKGGKDGVEFQGLVNFTSRLVHNPSYRAVNELYEFLEASDILINEDGMVECFKKVRGDFTDIHSGTFDNSVGKVCQVPRNFVDEDSERTCSFGLHVCSRAYLPSFGWAEDNRVIKVLVDPADFVAIPKDYYSVDGLGQVKAKARVCRYEVVSEVTDV